MVSLFDNSQLEIIYINNYKLILTCSAYPEQYDVFVDEKWLNELNISDEEKIFLKLKYLNYWKKTIGYLRLRYSHFTAEFIYENDNYEIVYENFPESYGFFDKNERMYYLHEAIKNINNKLLEIIK